MRWCRRDGKTVHTLTVRDVPVDGFWSIGVYNANGFFDVYGFTPTSIL
jgi:hypothetical protein